MRIGAMSAYGMQPYVYNANTVSAASMNKLSRISDDVLDKKIDYSELAGEGENTNPLKRGQTLNFQSMLEMQMQRGQNNAARIMRPAWEPKTEEEETVQAADTKVAQFAQAVRPAEETASGAGMTAGAGADNGGNPVSYQMQQALNAYGMFMTA